MVLSVSMVGQYVSAGRYLTAADRDQVYIGNGLALAMDIKVGDRFNLAGRTANKYDDIIVGSREEYEEIMASKESMSDNE